MSVDALRMIEHVCRRQNITVITIVSAAASVTLLRPTHFPITSLPLFNIEGDLPNINRRRAAQVAEGGGNHCARALVHALH